MISCFIIEPLFYIPFPCRISFGNLRYGFASCFKFLLNFLDLYTNWCKSGVYIVSHAVWKIKGLQKTLILRQKIGSGTPLHRNRLKRGG